jgi:hypothetical protein
MDPKTVVICHMKLIDPIKYGNREASAPKVQQVSLPIIIVPNCILFLCYPHFLISLNDKKQKISFQALFLSKAVRLSDI